LIFENSDNATLPRSMGYMLVINGSPAHIDSLRDEVSRSFGHIENLGTNPATGAAEAYSATSVLKTLGLLWDFEDFTPRVSNSPSFDHLIGPQMRNDAPLILTPPKPFPNDT